MMMMMKRDLPNECEEDERGKSAISKFRYPPLPWGHVTTRKSYIKAT